MSFRSSSEREKENSSVAPAVGNVRGSLVEEAGCLAYMCLGQAGASVGYMGHILMPNNWSLFPFSFPFDTCICMGKSPLN
jgi:hypothetical protein